MERKTLRSPNPTRPCERHLKEDPRPSGVLVHGAAVTGPSQLHRRGPRSLTYLVPTWETVYVAGMTLRVRQSGDWVATRTWDLIVSEIERSVGLMLIPTLVAVSLNAIPRLCLTSTIQLNVKWGETHASLHHANELHRTGCPEYQRLAQTCRRR